MTSADRLIPLPWQYPLWNTWYQATLSSKLPHALLLKGPLGSGKGTFIKAFANLILCTQPTWLDKMAGYYACGNCNNCVAYQANTHPNYYELKPKDLETTKPKILIDQVRELTHALQQTATNRETLTEHHSYQTIVVIESVDSLGTAQHALLKTLEEPRSGIVFLLTSARFQALEATIKSRCQCTSLPQPNLQQGIEWLRSTLNSTESINDDSAYLTALTLAGNQPLQALTYLRDNQIKVYETILESLIELGLKARFPSAASEKWMHYPFEDVLTYLMHATTQLLEQKLNIGVNTKVLPFTDTKMRTFIHQTSARQLIKYWSKVNEVYQQSSLYRLNAQIALEMLAYTFSNS